MYAYRDIRIVHFEITTKCNARCPQCPRNLAGGLVNPSLPQTELSLQQCQRLFPEDFARQLNVFYMCGDYGDPIAARDCQPVLQYLRYVNPTLRLKIHTNGGLRSPIWWQTLAALGCVVRFGIDGLEDTNHLYRRGVDWNTVIENATAFINAGGRAEWAFIVFRHNEHQVEKAADLSRQLGFARFLIKRTRRFYNYSEARLEERSAVRGLNGEIEYYLELPSVKEYQIPLTALYTSVSERPPLDDEIDCRAMTERMIYISAEGLALPCCWLGNLYPPDFAQKRPQIWTLIDRLPEGKRSLDALEHGIRHIVEGPFFREMVSNQWPPVASPDSSLRVCMKICGRSSMHPGQVLESLHHARP